MTPEQWQRLDQVFADARQQPADARAGVVARACGGDEALRAEALSLLAADEESGEFLNTPAADALANAIAADGWSLRPGDRVGVYTVDRLLGSGGSGEVWRARDDRLGRDVAIKVLLPHFSSDAERLRRFADEARTVGALNHANILAVYDVGEHRGSPFLVSECLDGESLRTRLERGPLAVDAAIAIGVQIARGLAGAHARGIVHRDLKPDNLFLRSDGGVKILDFGLAKLQAPAIDGLQATQPHTMTGVIAGTAGYMSPEQARGETIDKRADIWALGCVLFEMMTGVAAFGGATLVDVLGNVIGRDPDWRALPSNTPRAVRTLLRRCLQKDLARRLRDAGDAQLELEEVDADALNVPESSESARGRPAVVAWTIAGVAVLVAAAAVTALVTSRSVSPENRVPMRFSAVTSFPGVDAQPSFSPDGRSVAFISNRDGQWDIYVTLVTGGTLLRITNDSNVEAHPRWSPDGGAILFSRLDDAGRDDIWIVPALGGPARRLVLNGRSPAWSRDGRSIAYSSGGIIWVCDSNGANPRAVTRAEPPLAHYQPAFSRDGRSIAFIRKLPGPYGELAIVNVEKGSVKTITDDNGLALSPVWSPDDRFIYFTSSRGGMLNVWRIVAGGGEPEQITAGSGGDLDIDLSVDGTRLVFSSYKANVNIAELSIGASAGSAQKWLTRDSVRGEVFPRYSPDGRRIAFFSNRVGGERESVWVMDADGANANRIAEGIHPRWTADSQELVFGATLFWRTRTLTRVALAGGAPQSIPVEPMFQPWGDVAPDGRLLYRSSPRRVEIHDPRNNAKDAIDDISGPPLWSHDGRRFAFIVRPDAGKPSDAGLWTIVPGGARRHVFTGWILWFAWDNSGELWALEGRADLKGVLWRVDDSGERRVAMSAIPLFIMPTSPESGPQARFDVHPDGRRIVIDALEFAESDIGLIDNVR